MLRHILLRLEAPMMSFGDVIVGGRGNVDDIPSPSMITGLFGNALGWRRTDRECLQRLQDRLVMAVRRDREGERVLDFQTARLGKDDNGWTTRGEPEGRAGSPGTYDSPHLRYRWFDADASVTVAVRLEPAEEAPGLADIAAALDHPARPLFLGRKPCLPATRILIGLVDATDCLAALATVPLADGANDVVRHFWPDGEDGGFNGITKRRVLHGLRQWRNDVHTGRQVWREGGLRAASSA